MLYYGPVDSHGTGRNKIARKMLGQLEKRMTATGQTFGKWSQTQADGAIVTVWVMLDGGHPIRRSAIRVPRPIQPAVCELLSGLYSIRNYNYGGPLVGEDIAIAEGYEKY